jgi:hypothetical protein
MSAHANRVPYSTTCRVISGAARLSARSDWAKVNALDAAPRKCHAQRDRSRGKRNVCARWSREADDLDRPYHGALRTGQC